MLVLIAHQQTSSPPKDAAWLRLRDWMGRRGGVSATFTSVHSKDSAARRRTQPPCRSVRYLRAAAIAPCRSGWP